MSETNMTNANTITHRFDVPEERHGDFHAKIAKLAKRALKANLPTLEVALLRTSQQAIRPQSKLTRTIFHYAVSTLDTLSLGGWSLVAVIEYLPDGTPILNEVPGQTAPAAYRTGARTCDYCQLDRNRKETFVVSHADKGFKRVGRNCLSEFLGVSPERFLASVEWLKALKAAGDNGNGWSTWTPDTFTPLFLLTVSARVIAVDGYRSKTAADAYNAKVTDAGKTVRSTAQNTREYLDAMAGRLPKGVDQWGVHYDANKEVMAHYGEVTEADSARGAAVLAFAQAIGSATTYAFNVSTLANTQLVEWKHAGFLISVHGGWQREQDKAREQVAAPTADNRYLGTIGEKVTVTAIVTNAQTFDGDYGVRTLVTFKTPTGSSLKYWATGNKVQTYPRAATLTIKGTIKGLDEFKGTKQTVLTRVSVIG